MKRTTFVIWFSLIFLAVFTRIHNLNWGLPFLFHPDERNMAIAASTLSFSTLLDPHFYAYNQFPLYMVFFVNLTSGLPLTVERATLLLRVLSATFSVGSVYLWYLLLKELKIKKDILIQGVLIFICTPVFIQLAHFGTTESILIFFLLLCLVFIRDARIVGIAIGLSMATKISSVQLFVLPALYVSYSLLKHTVTVKRAFTYLLCVVGVAAIFTIAFSPHIILSYQKTLDTLRYESAVGMGTLPVFYTQQFIGAQAVFFQLFAIFPYALGIPLTILSIIGLLYVISRKPLYAAYFVVLFAPSAFLYTKWVRFMIYPYVILELVVLLTMQKMSTTRLFKIAMYIFVLFQVVFGLSFLGVYSYPDVRVRATEWINKHIPQGSTILTEGANVTDLPLYTSNNYTIHSLFLYDIERDASTKTQFNSALQTSDYIVIPSRRVFANTTCLLQKHDTVWKKCSLQQRNNKTLSKYYTTLFRGKVYDLIATFTSYPRIEFAGKTLFSLPDELAEETWSVFDHPVVRIYKKR